METVNIPKTGIKDIDAIIETQQNRISALKGTIAILEEIIKLKDGRIEQLQEQIQSWK